LAGEDLLRGIRSVGSSRANCDGILKARRDAEVEVLLGRMTAPGNFGPSNKTDFDRHLSRLAPRSMDAALNGAAFSTVCQENGKQPDLAAGRSFCSKQGRNCAPERAGASPESSMHWGPKVLTLDRSDQREPDNFAQKQRAPKRPSSEIYY